MSLSIVLDNAVFSHSIGSIATPDRSIVAGEFVMGSSSVINTVTSVPVVVTGTPDHQSNFITIDSYGKTTGFKTDVYPTNDISVFCVVKLKTGVPTMCSALGFSGLLNYTGVNFYNGQGGGAESSANLGNGVSINEWVVIGSSGKQGGKGKIAAWTSTQKLVAEATVNGSINRPRDNSFTIGYSESTGGSGVADFAYVLILDKALNDIEMQNQYESIKQFMSVRGIEVA